MNNAVMNIKSLLSNIWGIQLEVKLLSHTLGLFNFLRDYQTLPYFIFPLAMYEGSSSLTVSCAEYHCNCVSLKKCLFGSSACFSLGFFTVEL